MNLKENKNKFKRLMCEEHSGFAVTLEVLATLAMICLFLNSTLYVLRVMNVQRYMNTVMTSTAVQASRWGGVDTKAYKSNVSNVPLLTTAQNQLNYIAADFNPYISSRINGDRNKTKIENNGDEITIEIKYSLPDIFSTMSKVNNVDGSSYDMFERTRNMKMSINVNSIMEGGKLL